MNTKAETIDAICALNPSANPEFLVEFSNDELVRYLDRLTGPGGSHTTMGAGEIMAAAPHHHDHKAPTPT